MLNLYSATLALLAAAVFTTSLGCAGQPGTPTSPPTATATPPPPAYYGAQGCSIVRRVLTDLEDGRISQVEALERLMDGLLFLVGAEPPVKEAGAALARAITTPPYRAGAALLPFDELYPEGVTFRNACQTHGHW